MDGVNFHVVNATMVTTELRTQLVDHVLAATSEDEYANLGLYLLEACCLNTTPPKIDDRLPKIAYRQLTTEDRIPPTTEAR